MTTTTTTVTLDLTDDDTYWVLTTALTDFAGDQRSQVEADPEDATAESRTEWADKADALREQIETQLDNHGTERS